MAFQKASTRVGTKNQVMGDSQGPPHGAHILVLKDDDDNHNNNNNTHTHEKFSNMDHCFEKNKSQNRLARGGGLSQKRSHMS